MNKKSTYKSLMQKMVGLTMLLISILSVPVLNDDITVAVVLFPLGIYLFCSNDCIFS